MRLKYTQSNSKGYNPLTEELLLDFNVDVDYSKRTLHGYVAHFKLLNGFEKTLYWTKRKMYSTCNTI